MKKIKTIKTKNDLFPITPKIFYSREDSREFVSQNSTPQKTSNPLDHPMQNSETSSFIVDWQLPGIGIGAINKSYS